MGEEKQEWDVEIRFEGDMSIKIKRVTTNKKTRTRKHKYCFTHGAVNETGKWRSATNNLSNIVRCDRENWDGLKDFHKKTFEIDSNKSPFDTAQVMLVKYPGDIYLFSVPQTGKYLEPNVTKDMYPIGNENVIRFYPTEVEQYRKPVADNPDAIFFKDGTFRCIPNAIRPILGDNKLKSMPNRLTV